MVELSENKPKLSTKNKVAIISLLVIVLIGTFAVVSWMLNQNQNTTPNQNSSENTSLNTNPNPNTSNTTQQPTSSQTIQQPSSNETTQKQFVGSVKSNVYHYPSCSYAKRIHTEKQIWFTDSADARAHGYRPCSVCNPP